jgi:DNA polymerase
MPVLYLDLETYCETPIKNGVHRYAEDVEITLFAYAIDDGPVDVWDLTTGAPMPKALANAFYSDCEIVAHNTGFDRTVLNARNFKTKLPRWRDTMVQALAHSLPAGLGDLCTALGVPADQAKDKDGRRLVLLFCKPRPVNVKLRRATRDTHPADWAKFVAYAGQDIEAMRECRKRMPTWNYQGEELALWHLDQEINDRGVLVDKELAEAAVRAVDRAQRQLSRRVQEHTLGIVESATQRDAMLSHILNAYGVALPDLQASTLERRITDPSLPLELRELLAIRLQASTTSTAKYKTLINGVSHDNRLRGTLQFNGASRTGRWAGRLFQPQNLPRPSLKAKVIDQGIEALKANCADLLFDDVMELTSSAIRGCLVAPEGRKLVVADLSNIEGRMLAWLAGETWKVKAFEDFDAGQGHDLYALAYAKAFGVSPEVVLDNKENGDGSMRQIGKVMELALGYEGGVGAFLTFAAAYNINLEDMAAKAWDAIPGDVKKETASAYGYAVKRKATFDLSEQAWRTCDALKRMWRAAHPEVTEFWAEVQAAAIAALVNKGKTYECRRLMIRCDGAWLRFRLPSGRFLCYPNPQLKEGKLEYMGVNQYSRKWSRLGTYGGKLVENITQAASRDILASAMPLIEDAGYRIVLTVHDEIISEAPDDPAFNVKDLASLMSANPAWAQGLPLAAAGFETYRYRKD